VKVYKEHATIDNFSKMLKRQPNGIHFSGHGTKEALILESNATESVRLNSDDLVERLKVLTVKPNFVFLAACHS